MKKALLSALIVVHLITPAAECIAQVDIPYGSNHGKYQSINVIKLYYEEYGKDIPLLLIYRAICAMVAKRFYHTISLLHISNPIDEIKCDEATK